MSEEQNDNSPEVKNWEKENFHYFRTQDFTNVYSNNVNLGFTSWDMWMVFGEIIGEKEGKLAVHQRARVVMSLQHAKAFALLLLKNLRDFESKLGEIQLVGGVEIVDSEESEEDQRELIAEGMGDKPGSLALK